MTSMRLMVANLVLATLSYVASSTCKAARPGRIHLNERGPFNPKSIATMLAA